MGSPDWKNLIPTLPTPDERWVRIFTMVWNGFKEFVIEVCVRLIDRWLR